MPTPEMPDFAQYAAMMQQSMAEALARVDAAAEEARKERDAALEELNALKETRRQVQEDAGNVAVAETEKQLKALEARIRQDTYADVVRRLLKAGRSGAEIMEWLEVPVDMIEEARKALGFQQLGAADAWVEIEDQGRGGTIRFRRGASDLLFHYEFGAGNALALIFVPTDEEWEAQTGLPGTERLPVLDFVATRVIAQKAGGSRYALKGNVLEILYS
jgi:hypothetical protein